MNGGLLLAEALVKQGVEYVFGIVGYPVVEIGMTMQSVGLKFVGMRNEQAATYGASIIGYLTQRPAAVLCVSGPGMIHCLGGMSNACENCWPVIVIGGSGEMNFEEMGAFQEFRQVEGAKMYAKWAARPSSIGRIPFYVEKAVRMSTYGRPGAVYLDIPAEYFRSEAQEDAIQYAPVCPRPPKPQAHIQDVRQALQVLSTAKRPLVIIGKGAGYSCAEASILRFVTTHNLPFLPTPMGKGVVPDNHPCCVAAARSLALQKADVVLLLGARLNWILHFGLPPRYESNVKIIQVDICPEELNSNVQCTVALHGDIGSVVSQMNDVSDYKLECSVSSEWWKSLKEKVVKNQKVNQALAAAPSPPMNYYNAFYEIEKLIPRDCMFISEGSNTMDISRTTFTNTYPRHRLDAGSFGTMGLGAGFAIASALWCRDHHPGKRVICLQGDSAFGFAGMEVETVCRYRLPIIYIVINNSGIAQGQTPEDFNEAHDGDPTLNLLPMSLTPKARYDKMMSAFGGDGYFVETREALSAALSQCLQRRTPSLINVIIEPFASRKDQSFNWLTTSKV